MLPNEVNECLEIVVWEGLKESDNVGLEVVVKDDVKDEDHVDYTRLFTTDKVCTCPAHNTL
jgi:hypothetical protein